MKLVTAFIVGAYVVSVMEELGRQGINNIKVSNVIDNLEGYRRGARVEFTIPDNKEGSIRSIFQDLAVKSDKDMVTLHISSVDEVIELVYENDNLDELNGGAKHHKFKPNTSSRVLDYLAELRQ